jgi:Pectate lyase superfamily protein
VIAAPPPMGARCDVEFGHELPILNWQQRSDWINVRSEMRAVGDGKTDDTAAIQRALDGIGPSAGERKVVYFPPGRYVITKPLTITERHGAMLIGHGRNTTLVWSGGRGGRMLWSNGAARTTYLGLTFDGAGIAAVGIDHASKNLYETRVRHESLEFRDFTEAGVRVGHEQKLASAEMMFYNLVFRNNAVGVKFMAWNDYNNVFDGCMFTDNGYGVHAERGNVVVRNSRFERSRDSDVFLSTHSHSLRRIVSLNSNAFVRTVRGPAAAGIVKIQASYIDGWQSPEGAVVTDLRGPVIILDTVFARPPQPNSIPIKLNNPIYLRQQAIVSNVQFKRGKQVIDPGLNGAVRVIPPGRASITPTAATHFLRATVDVPQTIIDVKTDCGARGDGRANDTRAVQACLDRGASAGKGALVYFPSGVYRLSRTLNVADADFQIGGTGWHSVLMHNGFAANPLLVIEDPNGLVLEHLALGGPAGTTTLQQRGSKPGAVLYRGVYGYFDDETRDERMVFDSLPAGMLVQSDHLDGRLEIRNSGDAHILLGLPISVQMTISGESQPQGFLGVLSRVSALEDNPLVVSNNQSLVISDWYNEQTAHLLRADGGIGAFTGALTLDMSRAEATAEYFASIAGYRGQVTILGSLVGKPADDTQAAKVSGTETKEFTLAWIGNSFWNAGPAHNASIPTTVHVTNSVTSDTGDFMSTVSDTEAEPGDLATIRALDELRALSDMDFRYNNCK